MVQSARTGAAEAAAHAAPTGLVSPPFDAPSPIPFDEAQRLAHLRALQVLDTPPEPVFDSLARMASMLCGVPIALLCLVDAQRQ